MSAIRPEEGFEQSYAAPLPRVYCTYIDPSGNGCTSLSLRGATVCMKHGAALPEVQRHAASVLAAARMRLINSVDDAVDALVDLMQPGTPEGVRLKAAAEVLDRSGIRAGFELDVVVDKKQSSSDILAERLKRFQNGSVSVGEVQSDTDIIDAEIVDE